MPAAGALGSQTAHAHMMAHISVQDPSSWLRPRSAFFLSSLASISSSVAPLQQQQHTCVTFCADLDNVMTQMHSTTAANGTAQLRVYHGTSIIMYFKYYYAHSPLEARHASPVRYCAPSSVSWPLASL